MRGATVTAGRSHRGGRGVYIAPVVATKGGVYIVPVVATKGGHDGAWKGRAPPKPAISIRMAKPGNEAPTTLN